jgi:hypothetical protein
MRRRKAACSLGGNEFLQQGALFFEQVELKFEGNVRGLNNLY